MSDLFFLRFAGLWVCFLQSTGLSAQLADGVYTFLEERDSVTVRHELKIDQDYLIYTQFQSDPPEFIKTLGGFYRTRADTLQIALEFNSNYANDSLNLAAFTYAKGEQELIVNGKSFDKVSVNNQALDGQWLFATRGPDLGQERRNDENPRKTLKFLKDGHFQWVAYHTETFRFLGSGGGRYNARDGKYAEQLQFFSRDNSRAGAILEFNFELKGDDWHHRGNNSRGEPLYEIWARRL